jgi:catechol-2,3-dioxygenase
MLNTLDAIATVAVTDINAAKGFYEAMLGLTVVETQGSTVVTYRSGTSRLIVYQSPTAGTNQATAVTWLVGEKLDAIVRSLKDKGARFEHYNLPDARRDGDIHIAGDLRMAWLKDPAGNILALIGG